MRDPSVSLCNELIRDIRTERGLTIDRVSIITGYSRSHVHRMELGCSTVPIEFLSGLFRATRDLRILQLLDPSAREENIEQAPPPPPGDPMELVLAEIEATKKHAQQLDYLYRVVRDGVVDQADDDAITAYAGGVNALAQSMHRTRHALLALRERSRRETGQ